MHNIFLLGTFFLILFINACNQSEKLSNNKSNTKDTIKKEPSETNWNQLPEVSHISKYPSTDFVLTLENNISTKKNIIYAPAFLFAWDKIKNHLDSPIKISPDNSEDFKLINTSNSYQNTLLSSEYSASIEFGDGIVAKAFFNKTLPFSIPMEKAETPIVFNKTKVEAFGMEYYREYIADLAQILFYKDDNNFILKLIPADTNHEIILIKGITAYTTFADAIAKSNVLIKTGKKEMMDARHSWKYSFAHTDMFSIPVFKFNIDKNYSTLEGQKFDEKDNNKSHIIETAFQRTGFILNENGAVVESEAVSAVDSVGMPPKEAHPKKLVFNNPFLVIVKRKDSSNPYFMMQVKNEELMIKK